MKLGSKILLSLSLGLVPLQAATSGLMGEDYPIGETNDIVINNRILLKVNGKPLSVIDVVKKMDLLFYRQYPQLASSPIARYQFYLASWKSVLASLIDDHLVLADAEEKKLEITDGDVREELEELFGPDVVINIDKAGLTFDEAWDLLKNELTVRRMNSMMVRSKALNEVSPKTIRELYEEYIKTHPGEEKWVYQVLTFRGKDEGKVSELASEAYRVLNEEKGTIEQVITSLKDNEYSVQVNLSEEYTRVGKEISDAHKLALQALGRGMYSQPLLQTAKKGSEAISRVFLLKDYQPVTTPAFDDLKKNLQQELTQKAIIKYTQTYLEKLRSHYGITDAYLSEMIPNSLEPFTLR